MPRERPTLAETQDALASLISGPAMGSAPAAPFAFIVSDQRASAPERLAVYAFMYRARLVEALASQFPRLAKQVGAEAFAELVSAYVDEHPSTHPSLRFLGASFADWLTRRHPRLGLEDLARLEWARSDIFDAADEPVLDVEAIRAWPQERFAELPVRLIAAHRQLVLAGGTVAAWQSIGDDASLDDQTVDGDALAASRTESVLVWRQGVSVFHRVVGGAEREALLLAAAGTTLGHICECAGAQADIVLQAAIRQAFAWLWGWANDQLLARC
jgi:hypothetical protein